MLSKSFWWLRNKMSTSFCSSFHHPPTLLPLSSPPLLFDHYLLFLTSYRIVRFVLPSLIPSSPFSLALSPLYTVLPPLPHKKKRRRGMRVEYRCGGREGMEGRGWKVREWKKDEKGTGWRVREGKREGKLMGWITKEWKKKIDEKGMGLQAWELRG